MTIPKTNTASRTGPKTQNPAGSIIPSSSFLNAYIDAAKRIFANNAPKNPKDKLRNRKGFRLKDRAAPTSCIVLIVKRSE